MTLLPKYLMNGFSCMSMPTSLLHLVMVACIVSDSSTEEILILCQQVGKGYT